MARFHRLMFRHDGGPLDAQRDAPKAACAEMLKVVDELPALIAMLEDIDSNAPAFL